MTEELTGDEVLRFQRNNYTSMWGPAIRDIRSSGLFHDITLVTTDCRLVTAHRIVLAACSAFFRDVLSTLPLPTAGPHNPSVLYMRGVTGPILLKLLEFMYNGEVDVKHQLLTEFLQIGEDLRVEGLCEKRGVVNNQERNQTTPAPVAPLPKQKENKEKIVRKKRKVSKPVEQVEALPATVSSRNKRKEPEKANDIPPAQTSSTPDNRLESEPTNVAVVTNDNAATDKFDVYEMGNSSDENESLSLRDDSNRSPRKKAKRSMEDLKEEVINRDVLTMDPGEAHGILKLVEGLDIIEENSEDLNVFVRLLNQLILKSDVASNVLLFCGICQKSLKSRANMLNHIETGHVTGVFHKCSECPVKFKTRSSLNSHKCKVHKKVKKDDLKADDAREDDDKAKNDTSMTEANSQITEQLTNNIQGSEDVDMEQ